MRRRDTRPARRQRFSWRYLIVRTRWHATTMSGASELTDVYLSLDVEADGPIPGRYSMLSLGLCVAGRYDGRCFEASDPTAQTFYRELQPAGEEVNTEALAVAGLDRERLSREGIPAPQAMAETAAWIGEVAGADRPVICAFPAAFDWCFFWWYMVAFGPTEPPLSFSSCLDMKTMLAVRGGRTLSRSGKDQLPPELRPSHPHTHNALDDAIEQADIFARLFCWSPGA